MPEDDISQLTDPGVAQCDQLRFVAAAPEYEWLPRLPIVDSLRCLSREGHPGIELPKVCQGLQPALPPVASEIRYASDRVRPPSNSIWLRLYSWIRCAVWSNAGHIPGSIHAPQSGCSPIHFNTTTGKQRCLSTSIAHSTRSTL